MNATTKCAAALNKGDLPVICISESKVREYLNTDALLDGLKDGFVKLAAGEIQTPPRPQINNPDKGFSLTMSAWTQGMKLAVKIVNVFESNLSIGLPNHLATINLFDPDTGQLLCIMDGTYITGVRTAASAIVSADALAPKGARIAAVIGAGVQGKEHVRLLPAIREFEEIRIASLEYSDAQYLADTEPRAIAVHDIEHAVRDADVVCLASHAYEPVIESGWISAGTHVTSVGYAPPSGELPVSLAAENALFVETLDAFEAPPVGCAELINLPAGKATLIGDVLSGSRPGRVSESQITVYKAMGNAMEDMVAANIVYEQAKTAGVGDWVKL